MSSPYANAHDRHTSQIYRAREADWRNGALVYQVIVDRFAPSADLERKRHLYPAPKQLRSWDENPQYGHYLDDQQVWSHELDFWGGDIASLRAHLDYIDYFGADVLYLCPIHLAWTNHGYDALDYQQVRPEYGTRADVAALADDLHARGMRLVLDGVFNHMGRNAPAFQAGLANPKADTRSWFAYDDSLPGGARAWANAKNLPETRVESPEFADYVHRGRDSVVRSWLRDGADGWRLDVAFELGMAFLGDITASAHEEKPGSLVLGEIVSYPAEWFPELDAILHFTLRQLLVAIAHGEVNALKAQSMLEQIYRDADFGHMLKSWLYLDNHDQPRVVTAIPDHAAREVATILMYTLPGSVNIYYGSELGMPGGDDPENRAPMRWDWVNDANPTLTFHRRLNQIYRDHRALRIGDIRWIVSDELIAFERHTDQVRDCVIVLANPSDHDVTETLLVPDSKIMDWGVLADLLSDERVTVHRSFITVTVPAKRAMVLVPLTDAVDGYTPYKRMN